VTVTKDANGRTMASLHIEPAILGDNWTWLDEAELQLVAEALFDALAWMEAAAMGESES